MLRAPDFEIVPRRDKANRLRNAPASPVGPYLAAFRIHATASVITFSVYATAIGGMHFTLKRNDVSVVIVASTTRRPCHKLSYFFCDFTWAI
jgi:hypothetical protein